MHLADPHQLGDERKALDRGQRAVDVLVGELARLGEAAAERAGGLFVVERRQRAGMALIDDKTHRVGADIEHGNGLAHP